MFRVQVQRHALPLAGSDYSDRSGNV